MELVRNRRDIKLRRYWDRRYGAKNLIASPNFQRLTIFDEELVAIEMSKTEVFLNKPIIIGMSILDISKIAMYEFHYNHMKKKYGDQCVLAYTDTDSFVYSFLDDANIYDDIKLNSHFYDTSDYPVDNQYGIARLNKKSTRADER